MTDEPPLQPTIRNAVIHLHNEQPLLADLFELPQATDQGLRCTNLRTLNGKRPVFADDVDSFFYFPYQHIRFVEIHPSKDRPMLEAPDPAAEAASEESDEELEIDEDFLRRIRDV